MNASNCVELSKALVNKKVICNERKSIYGKEFCVNKSIAIGDTEFRDTRVAIL